MVHLWPAPRPEGRAVGDCSSLVDNFVLLTDAQGRGLVKISILVGRHHDDNGSTMMGRNELSITRLQYIHIYLSSHEIILVILRTTVIGCHILGRNHVVLLPTVWPRVFIPHTRTCMMCLYDRMSFSSLACSFAAFSSRFCACTSALRIALTYVMHDTHTIMHHANTSLSYAMRSAARSGCTSVFVRLSLFTMSLQRSQATFRTSLLSLKPTCPTSMLAVLRRLDHGV